MTGWLRLELARTARDLRYLTLAVVAPVGFYLLFASVFGGRSSAHNTTFGLPATSEIMVAMATFGAMWAALSATAPRLARDREGGWLDFLATTPLRPGSMLAARVLAAMLVALPAIVAVTLTAAIAHGVSLPAWRWLAMLALLWAGTLPFVVLGIALGTLAGATVAYALSTSAWFAMAALGGLWVPPGQLSPGLRDVAHILPSYNQAALGWHVVSNTAPSLGNLLVLAVWSVALAAIALVAGARRRHRPVSGPLDPHEAVALSGVVKRFGSLSALDRLDLQIDAGETVALLGPNGSGKTTAIAVLLGLLNPDAGAARLFGASPRTAVCGGRVGAMLQDTELMSGVRVSELLRFVRGLYPRPLEQVALSATATLEQLMDRRTDQLSGGQAQRVRFALALAGNPSLLVLDEPTAAMDVRARQELWAAIHEHVAEHEITVLFCTHYLQEADEHAGRVVLIRSGRVLVDGTPTDIKAAAGGGRVVRFRLLRGEPENFRDAPGVISIAADRDTVTINTDDADATVWGIYDKREQITDLRVTDSALEDAFLALTSTTSETPTGVSDSAD